MKTKKENKVLGIIADVLLIILIIVAIIISILTFSSKASNNGVANILGYSPFAVQSDSMSGTFEKGDLIISKTKDIDTTGLKVGDIITFYTVDKESGLQYFNSHRIVKVEYFDDEHSYAYYTTKGDNTPANDPERVGSSEVVGVYTGKKINNIGSVLTFLQTQTGFMVCVLIPLALFFLWQVYKFFGIVLSNKKEKMIEQMSDEDKQRIAEEYIKNQKQ